MKNIRLVALLLSFIALASGLATAAPTTPTAYSVDVKVTTPKNSRTGKVYVSGNSARTDTTDNKGRSMISIHNATAKEFYLLFPKTKTYRVYNLDKIAKDNDVDPVVPSQVKGQTLGSENVAGQACDKVKYQTGAKVAYVWLSKKTGLPVLMISGDQQYRAEYTNAVVAPQPASLFTPPADYKRVQGTDSTGDG